MSRAPNTSKQRDMSRAIKAVMAAGLAVARVEVASTARIRRCGMRKSFQALMLRLCEDETYVSFPISFPVSVFG